MAKVIVNRKAKFEYHFLDTFEAGIMLTGPEVKSIRAGEASIAEAYCMFKSGQLYIRNLYIAEYKLAHQAGLDTKRERKLLLKNRELRKLEKRTKEKGFTIVPYRIYLSERGLIKVEVVLAQGKKSFDKRSTIKDRDIKRDMDRAMRGRR